MDNYEIYTPHIENEEPPVISGSTEEQSAENRKSPNGRQNKNKKHKANKNPKDVKQSEDKSIAEMMTSIRAFFHSPMLRQIVGIFLGCLAIYLLISFISYITACVKDQSIINSTPVGSASRISNHGGEGGARLSELLINRGFGVGSFVIIVWLGAMCLKLLTGHPKFKSVNFTIKCFVALLTVSLIVGISGVVTNSYVNWGGYHAHYVYEFINRFIGYGSYILCFFMVALFVIICLNDVVVWVRKKYSAEMERRRIIAEEKAAERERQEALMRDAEKEEIDDLRAGESAELQPAASDYQDPSDVMFSDSYVLDDLPEEEVEYPAQENIIPEESLYVNTSENESSGHDDSDNTIYNATENIDQEVDNNSINQDAEEAIPSEKDHNNNQENSDVDKKMVVHVNQIDQVEKKHFKSEIEYWESVPYKFPPYNLMAEGAAKINVDAEEQLENKKLIETTLLEFGIPIIDIQSTVGPTVTLYEIVPDKGIKISKIRNLSDDIAMRLAAKGVRIIAPIPGKGTIGIEVSNKHPQTVYMQTVIRSRKYQENKYKLPMALGSTISNEVYISDLAKMPHLLVAGATGQGKSVGLNAIIASLLYCRAPYQLKFVMIDPKCVEFSLYNKLKNHYMAVIPDDIDTEEPVITDMKKVEATLNSLCIEMDDRYTLLKNAHTRNIEEYNAKIREGVLDPREGHKFLPYIVVVVDEFADLIMTAGKNVEMPIARLAQKARAVGIHVILATQRPSTDVITGMIKANFPARISFKVSSGIDSKTILDTTGAQQLIGMGDMLIFHNSDMTRVQCAYIDTPEIEKISEYISRQPNAPGPYLLPEPPMSGEEGNGGGSAGGPMTDRDPLFEEAARRVVQSGTASTSSLQRVYGIGYNRAGKIMDQLEACGIVGPSQGGKPRAVLVDPMELENILASV